MTVSSIGRRDALKARHRAAILDAARALLEEREGGSFSVDELADRADVARRTVFNHFASLDEVLLAACTDALAVLVDDFLASVASTAIGDGSRSSMLDELTVAMLDSDLPTAIATMVRITGGPGRGEDRTNELAGIAFGRVAGRLQIEVARRHPAADPLDVDLLVGSLMNGVSIIAAHWVQQTGARLDEGSRAEWEQLLARLLHSIRAGYMPA